MAASIPTSRPGSPLEASAAKRALIVVATGIACGLVATGIAQLRVRDLIPVAGLLALMACLMVVRQRALLVLVVMVLSLQVLFHKAIGPVNQEIASGAQAIYVTSLDVMVLMLYALWLFEGRMVQDLRRALKERIFIVPLVAAAAASVSVLTATNTHLVVSELVKMGWMYALFLYVAVRVRTRAEVGWVAAALFGIAAVQCLVVVLQWRTGGSLGLSFLGEESLFPVRDLDDQQIPRPSGTVINTDFLAALIPPIGIVALSLAINLKHLALRLLCLLFVPIAVVTVAISQARGALLAMGLAVLVLSATYFFRGRLPWQLVLTALAGAGIAVLIFWSKIDQLVRDWVTTEHFRLELDARLELNGVALQMFRDSPLTGIGLNNFQTAMERYDVYGLIFAGNPVHNLYLLVLSETGVIGFLPFLLMLGALLVIAIRLAGARDRLLGAIGAGVAASYLFFYLEEALTFSLREDMPLALFWILSGLALACSRMRPEASEPALAAAHAA